VASICLKKEGEENLLQLHPHIRMYLLPWCYC
jgi:hypothetical protein